MATERLRVILELAASQYRREARQAATATGSIAKEAKTASTSVDRMGRSTSRVGSAVGKLGGVLVGAFAVNRIVDFAGDSIQAFSDLEQSIGGTEAVFGSARDTIDDFARNSAQAVGLAESEFRTATTGIGGQLKRMTGDVQFAAEQSVILTEVAADLAATYGGTTQQAVEALGSAFRGEADPAERFNLNLKIGVVNAKAVELGLAKTTGAVDDNARAQATLALIMEQSTDAQGQFAREADTVAGAQQRLAARAEDAKAAIGEGLLPVMTQLLEISEGLIPKARTLATILGAFFAGTDVQRWAIQTGQAAQSGELLAGSLAEIAKEARGKIGLNLAFGGPTSLAEQFKEVIKQGDFTDDALRKVRDGLDFLTESGHLTASEARILSEVLGEELALTTQDMADHAAALEEELDILHGTTKDVGDASADAVPSVEALAFQLEREAAAARAAREEQAKYRTALREALDPLAQIIRLSQDHAEKQKTLNEAVDKYGSASDEAREAALELAGTNSDLRAAFDELRTQGIDPTSAAAQLMFQDLGIPPEVLSGILDDFSSIQDYLNNNPLRMDVIVNDFHVPTPATRGGSPRQHGGPVTGRQPYIVGERGPELFVPQTSGHVISNADIKQLIAGLAGAGGRNVNYNIPINSTGNQNADAQLVGAVASVLRRMETL